MPIPGISGFSEFCSRYFYGIFWRFSNPDPGPRIFTEFFEGFLIPGISGISRFFTRDFFEIFRRCSNPDPDPRDFGNSGIFHSGFFRDFQMGDPDPHNFGIPGSRKNPIPKPNLLNGLHRAHLPALAISYSTSVERGNLRRNLLVSVPAS